MNPQARNKATVFSIVPCPISEFKPGIYPGRFEIDPCYDDEIPKRLVIDKPSTGIIAIGNKESSIAVKIDTYDIAQSIVADYLASAMFSDEECHPGITFVVGEVSTMEFIENHSKIHRDMIASQNRWFLKLVGETDRDWGRYPGNLRVVSAVARFAANYLKLDKEWTKDVKIAMENIECPACRIKNDPKCAVCTNCRCILNSEKYKALTFAS